MKNLYCRTFGHGPPLVLIHGWAMHSVVWLNFAKLLAKDFQVTLVDLPGAGGSCSARLLPTHQLAKELQTNLAEPALWLGWSLGGQLVTTIARGFPNQVKGLVTVGWNPKFVADQDWPGVGPEWLDHFENQLERDPDDTLHRFLGQICLGTPKPRSLFRQLKADWSIYPNPDLTVLKQGLVQLRQGDFRSWLSQIHCPVTLIVGDADPLVPVEAVIKAALISPHGTARVVEQGGHVPFLAHPEVTASMIREMANGLG